jgi:hypothetical protein
MQQRSYDCVSGRRASGLSLGPTQTRLAYEASSRCYVERCRAKPPASQSRELTGFRGMFELSERKGSVALQSLDYTGSSHV